MAEELAREAQAAVDRRRLNAAAARAERGEIALTQLNYLRAAGHFEQASTLVPAEDNDRRGEYLRRYADALYRHGDERGDNIALLSAMDVYRQALEALPRARVPLQWAGTQNNLGNALQTLGERESGTARLQEAVAAYRAALEERTRERVPLAWAATQMNLGSARLRLGQRESGTARLEEAVEAFHAALEEYTHERVPLDWARTQTGLGSALFSLGERTKNARTLDEAREAIDAAFAVYMQAGQEHHRAYFEDLLRIIDDHRARLQTTLKAQ
jgi:tetratricopeptide (TPR) repeat protein